MKDCKKMKEKIYVFLADGFEEIEALGVVDILKRAELQVVTVGINAIQPVFGAFYCLAFFLICICILDVSFIRCRNNLFKLIVYHQVSFIIS